MALTEYRLANLLHLSDGSAVEWESIGDGPALMWVEGGPGFWVHLARPDVQLVADTFTCYLVNAPGCGRTSSPADVDGYSLASIVEFFERVRVALGLESVTVMGHSWGGLIAAAWAARSPAVERLVVIDGYAGGAALDDAGVKAAESERDRCFSHHASAPWYPDAIRALEADDEMDEAAQSAGDEEAWVSLFDAVWPFYFFQPTSAVASPHLERIRSEVRMNMEVSFAWYGGASAFDDVSILDELSIVRCPSLVVAGEYDFICGPSWNVPIAEAITGSKYVQIAETGHFPHYEEPEVFRSALSEWMTDTTPSRQ
jgi:proline iminopeptidase